MLFHNLPPGSAAARPPAPPEEGTRASQLASQLAELRRAPAPPPAPAWDQTRPEQAAHAPEEAAPLAAPAGPTAAPDALSAALVLSKEGLVSDPCSRREYFSWRGRQMIQINRGGLQAHTTRPPFSHLGVCPPAFPIAAFIRLSLSLSLCLSLSLSLCGR